MSVWACPTCGASLAEALTCSACRRAFPRVAGVPVLLADPRQALSAAVAVLGERRSRTREALMDAAAAAGDPRLAFRNATFSAYQAALVDNDLLDEARLGATLEALVRAGGPLPQPDPPGPALMSGALRYLYADWGRQAGEAPTATVSAFAAKLLASALAFPSAATPDCALFLGAGTGRQAFDLAPRFSRTLAIDLSFEALWLCARMFEQDLDYHLLQDSTPTSAAELTLRCKAPRQALPPGLSLAIADAQHLPLANASVSHVFSLFFTDVLPLPTLLAEVRRVLRPAGAFLHVGPLDYHAKSLAWHLAPDELERGFAARGFQTGKVERFPLEFQPSPGDGMQMVYDAFAFLARPTP